MNFRQARMYYCKFHHLRRICFDRDVGDASHRTLFQAPLSEDTRGPSPLTATPARSSPPRLRAEVNPGRPQNRESPLLAIVAKAKQLWHGAATRRSVPLSSEPSRPAGMGEYGESGVSSSSRSAHTNTPAVTARADGLRTHGHATTHVRVGSRRGHESAQCIPWCEGSGESRQVDETKPGSELHMCRAMTNTRRSARGGRRRQPLSRKSARSLLYFGTRHCYRCKPHAANRARRVRGLALHAREAQALAADRQRSVAATSSAVSTSTRAAIP